MPDVSLTIDGRHYNIYCDEGQEPRVRALGAFIDKRLMEVTGNQGGGSNNSQALVLTALLLADELLDMREALARTAEISAQPPAPPVYEGLSPEHERVIGDEIARLASRIENLAARVQNL